MRRRLLAALLLAALIAGGCRTSDRETAPEPETSVPVTESTAGTSAPEKHTQGIPTGGSDIEGNGETETEEPSTEEPVTEPPEPEGPQFEMVLITDGRTLLGGLLNQTAWESLNACAEANSISHRIIRPQGNDTAAFLAAADEVCRAGARFVVMVSGQAAEAFEQAQAKYPNVSFLLVNGNPAEGRATSLNARSGEIRFRSEESAYVAGWCAAAAGYRQVGIVCLAGEESSSVNARAFAKGMSDLVASLNAAAEQAFAAAHEGETPAEGETLPAFSPEFAGVKVFTTDGTVTRDALREQFDRMGETGVQLYFCASASLGSAVAGAAGEGRAVIVSDPNLDGAYGNVVGALTITAAPAVADACVLYGTSPDAMGGQVFSTGLAQASVGFVRTNGGMAGVPDDALYTVRQEIASGTRSAEAAGTGPLAAVPFLNAETWEP